MKSFNWLAISGYNAHIKATPSRLIIQRNGTQEEYAIKNVRHLLIVGRHTLHTNTIAFLLRSGCHITFFENDGEPIGTLRSFGEQNYPALRDLQKSSFSHTYAFQMAQSSIKSRIRTIQQMNEEFKTNLFYESELELLQSAVNELDYLIKLEEIRRIHRLCTDMYYEIMSRLPPKSLGFKRRTIRPYQDPINVILSFGYALLFGNCYVSVIGADLDPDIGMLHEGKAALVYDLIDSLKARMIDIPVFRDANLIGKEDFEYSESRCILSESFMKTLIGRFRGSLDQKIIDEQVNLLKGALLNENEIQMLS